MNLQEKWKNAEWAQTFSTYKMLPIHVMRRMDHMVFLWLNFYSKFCWNMIFSEHNFLNIWTLNQPFSPSKNGSLHDSPAFHGLCVWCDQCSWWILLSIFSLSPINTGFNQFEKMHQLQHSSLFYESTGTVDLASSWSAGFMLLQLASFQRCFMVAQLAGMRRRSSVKLIFCVALCQPVRRRLWRMEESERICIVCIESSFTDAEIWWFDDIDGWRSVDVAMADAENDTMEMDGLLHDILIKRKMKKFFLITKSGTKMSYKIMRWRAGRVWIDCRCVMHLSGLDFDLKEILAFETDSSQEYRFLWAYRLKVTV